MAKKGVSLRALARALGVRLQAVQDARDAHRITPEPDGSWKITSVRKQWALNTNHAKRHRAKDKGKSTLEGGSGEANGAEEGPSGSLAGGWNKARTDETTLKARLLELRLRKQLGELLDADAVRTVAKTQSKAACDKIMSLPSSLAPELLGITTLEEMTAKLEDALGRVCDELATYPASTSRNGTE